MEKPLKPHYMRLNKLTQFNMKLPTPNESTADRIIRAILAVLMFALGYFYLPGYWSIAAYVVAVAALVTAAMGYCHFYTLMGWNTTKSKK